MRCLRIAAALALAGGLAACSSLPSVSLNPVDWFSGGPSGPKPAELPALTNPQGVKTLWTSSIGASEAFVFSPALAGDSVYVASRAGNIAALVIDTGAAGFVSCGCSPSGLSPMGNGTLLRLNEISDGPLMLVDTSGTQLRTWFVPALARSAQ